ncbi:secretion protein EspA [Shewanella sp. OPT22]|nr:secretion protein EspA [Shewanella sp. OPT22]
MIKGHVQGNIKTLKNKYGLNDDKLNHIHNLVEADNATAAQGDIVLSGGIAVLYLFMNLLSDIAQFKYLEMQQKAKVSRDAQNMANTVQEQIADVSKGDNPDTTKVSLDPNVIKYMEENDVKVGDQTIDQYLDKKGGGLDDLSNCTFASSNGDGHKLYLSKDTKTGQWSAIDDDARHKLLAAHSKDIVNDLKSISMPIPRPTVNATDGTISVTIGDASQLSRNSKYPSSIKDGTKFSGKVDGAKATFNQLDKGQLDAVKSALENESNRASDYVSQSQLQLQKVMQTYNVTVSLINSMQTMLEEMNKSIAQNIR